MHKQQQQQQLLKIGGLPVDFLPSVEQLGYDDGIDGRPFVNPNMRTEAGTSYALGYWRGLEYRESHCLHLVGRACTMTGTLLALQEATIARMMEPRTSQKRAAKNRSAAIRAYRAELTQRGYPEASHAAMIQDVRDMYELRAACEEA